MPDNILLDNYEDDFPHIHLDMAKIKKKTLYETLLIVKYRKEYYFWLNFSVGINSFMFIV